MTVNAELAYQEDATASRLRDEAGCWQRVMGIRQWEPGGAPFESAPKGIWLRGFSLVRRLAALIAIVRVTWKDSGILRKGLDKRGGGRLR
jgi:hypothetical protein